MTFCQIFEVASRVRQKVVDHRSLTIQKCSVQEKKVVGDKKSLMAGSLMTGSTVLQTIHPHVIYCVCSAVQSQKAVGFAQQHPTLVYQWNLPLQAVVTTLCKVLN